MGSFAYTDVVYYNKESRKTIMFDPPFQATAIKVMYLVNENGKTSVSLDGSFINECWSHISMDFKILETLYSKQLTTPEGTCTDTLKLSPTTRNSYRMTVETTDDYFGRTKSP
jgi:hypothetical protein